MSDIPFPIHLLRPGDRVLCVFSAAFLGRNAEAYIRDAGHLDVTCVDHDKAKLDEMAKLYPAEWTFVCADAWTYPATQPPLSFDVVVLDPWTQHVDRVMDAASEWAALARRVVVFGVTAAWLVDPSTAGLRHFFSRHGVTPESVIKRSDYMGGVWWIAGVRS